MAALDTNAAIFGRGRSAAARPGASQQGQRHHHAGEDQADSAATARTPVRRCAEVAPPTHWVGATPVTCGARNSARENSAIGCRPEQEAGRWRLADGQQQRVRRQAGAPHDTAARCRAPRDIRRPGRRRPAGPDRGRGAFGPGILPGMAAKRFIHAETNRQPGCRFEETSCSFVWPRPRRVELAPHQLLILDLVFFLPSFGPFLSSRFTPVCVIFCLLHFSLHR